MDETATCFCCLTKLMEIPEEQLLQCTCPCRQIRCTPCQQHINEDVDMSKCVHTNIREFQIQSIQR
jgi:hypothetical protein